MDAALLILAFTALIDAQTQAPAHFLPAGDGIIAVFQSADNEHVRIVPALAQGGMGENEAGGFVQGEQAFLVPED